MIALSQDFIENAVRILVTRFIPLHSSDLERWVEDPEEWVSEESKDNDQWEYEIRTLDFKVEAFTSYLPTAVSELVKLLSEAETADTKRQIAKSLNIVIQQSGTEVFQHAIAAKARPLRRSIGNAYGANDNGPPCFAMLVAPSTTHRPMLLNILLGTSVGDDWLFKSTLLGTVTNLLGALANLDEDALVLWLAALRNTTSIHGMNGAPGLLDLFPIAMSMLASNFDLLGSVVEIATSYLFLDARTILAVRVFTNFPRLKHLTLVFD
ncbi:ARM repeat-containing protein [Salix suchowensis]|nr:ARM repeat-containing protein [Salix suchowensis]